MSSLQKISLKKLLTLQGSEFESYHNVLKHLQPHPFLQPTPIVDFTFGEVAKIKMLLQNTTFENVIELFKTIFKIDEGLIYNMDVVQFYETFNWINNEVKQIIEREVENLSSEPDSKLKDAGVDSLNIFKELNTLILLGEKFATPPQEVENWNYSLVFGLMLHNKITNDINRRLVELNKSKTND